MASIWDLLTLSDTAEAAPKKKNMTTKYNFTDPMVVTGRLPKMSLPEYGPEPAPAKLTGDTVAYDRNANPQAQINSVVTQAQQMPPDLEAYLKNRNPNIPKDIPPTTPEMPEPRLVQAPAISQPIPKAGIPIPMPQGMSNEEMRQRLVAYNNGNIPDWMLPQQYGIDKKYSTENKAFEKSKQEDINQEKSGSNYRKNVLIDPAEWEQAVRSINELPFYGMGEQFAGLEEYNKIKQQLQNAAQNPAWDLGPLLGYSDKNWGTNLLATYKPPKTREDYIAMMADLEKAAQQARTGLTDKQLEQAKLMLSDRVNNYYGLMNQGKQETERGTSTGTTTNVNIIPQERTEKDKAEIVKKATAREPTQKEFEDAGFANRMLQAEEVLSGLSKKGFDRTAKGNAFQSMLPDAVKSPELKQWDQAERNFIFAVLRKETGQRIEGDEQEQYAKMYFPRANDDAQTIANKQALRKQKIEEMLKSAGPALNRVEHIPGKGTPQKKPIVKQGKSEITPSGNSAKDFLKSLIK